MNRLVRAMIAAASLGAAAWGAGHAYIATHRNWPDPSPGDAVLVLGTSSTMVGGRPNPCMRVRVGEGVRLIQSGLAPVLIVSGGLDPSDGLVEAETMADLAVEMGLDRDQVLIEDRSTSTIENLTYSKVLLGVDDPTFVVVTEPFHLPRAVMAADLLGIDVEPAPSPTCSDRNHTWILREPIALWWYVVKLWRAATDRSRYRR